MVLHWILWVVAGIMINWMIKFVTPSLGSVRRGIDVMPSFPIFIGYVYGFAPGFWSGVIISAAYYMTRSRRLSYAPLVIFMNAVVGALAAFLPSWDFVALSLLLLAVYHVVSGSVFVAFNSVKPGYALFVFLNVVVSILFAFLLSNYAVA